MSDARDVDVLVVGGGPAGLAIAIELRRLGAGRVLVVDREADAGGTPRHTDHLGFGMRDLRRLMRGPAYARRYVELAARAGVDVQTSTTIDAWATGGRVAAATPSGMIEISPGAVVLATGVRERPRAARLVPGDRPLGVLTTGALQQLVSLHGERVGRRAVVVGAEHVSFSAVMTLRHSGCDVAAVVTPLARHQSYEPLRRIARAPVACAVDVAEIHGRRRVEAVTLTDGRRIDCDTVVFTGDWIPEHELARRGGLAIDASSRAPIVDAAGRTSRPGVFAVGNLVHPAQTADVCALGGRRRAAAVAEYLTHHRWPASVAITVDAPVRWVHPGCLVPAAPISAPLLARVGELAHGRLRLRQGARTLAIGRRGELVPNRSLHLPAPDPTAIDPDGGALVVEVDRA